MSELQGHVLIVDDLETNRDALVRMLQREGLTTDEAKDGVDALEKVRSGSYDTILLDVMMPRMDGMETLSILKQDKEQCDIPVIMLSALNETKAVLECIRLGADDYLPKPIDRALLRARLSSCLRRKQLQDREREYKIRLEATNQELRRLNHLKSRFLAIAAHDLKNPMTTVLLLVDQMLETDEATAPLAKQKLSARRIRDSIHRMLGIVQGLLDSAAYETGNFELQPRLVDLAGLAKSIADENRVYAASKRIHLQSFLECGPMPALIDEMRIREAMENLVNNAIKFSPLDAEVEICLDRSGEFARLRVTDHGPGLTDEDKDRVFGPYQRLSAKPTGGEVSTGIGLSIVKQMVELHGGKVWVESEQGKGASFFMELPLQEKVAS